MRFLIVLPLAAMAVAAAVPSAPEVSLAGGLAAFPVGEIRKPRLSSAEVRVEPVAPGVSRVEWRFTPLAPQMGGQLAVRLRFLPGRPELWDAARKDFHWIPNIKTQPEQVASDHVFRSPAAILIAGGAAVALVPDLEALAKNRPASQYLDMGFPAGQAPFVEFGFAATEPVGHTYYRLGGPAWEWEFIQPVTLSAYVLTAENTNRRDFLARVSEFLWEKNGRPRMARVAPQTAPFSTVADYGYGMALRDLWVEGPEPGSGGITLVTYLDEKTLYRGRSYPRDLWFHAWFNNMRTAYGMYLWGKRLNRPLWMERARETARLLALAPRESGLFATIYVPDGKRWDLSGQGGGPDVYHLADNAWSALWLLRFHEDCEPVPGAPALLREFAGRLLALQRADGSFPARLRRGSLEPEAALDRSAESALPLWFLGEMALAKEPDPGVRRQASGALRRGLDFLRANVLGPQRFEDFEVVYSCSAKDPGYFDPSTELFAQGTLALQWCAEAFRAGYLLNRRAADLDDGRFCLNLMNLYQQVWSPPYLDLDAFGGYGVMNTDAEWNDARQAQFAVTNANYFDLTGERSYLERAVAAMRASFTLVVMEENKSVAPRNYRGTPVQHEVHGASAENYGHSGGNARSYQSGFHWGTGSALATAALLTARYGDLYVDEENRWALGIDGNAVALAQSNAPGELKVEALAPVRRISGRVSRPKAGTLRVNGQAAQVQPDGRFEIYLPNPISPSR